VGVRHVRSARSPPRLAAAELSNHTSPEAVHYSFAFPAPCSPASVGSVGPVGSSQSPWPGRTWHAQLPPLPARPNFCRTPCFHDRTCHCNASLHWIPPSTAQPALYEAVRTHHTPDACSGGSRSRRQPGLIIYWFIVPIFAARRLDRWARARFDSNESSRSPRLPRQNGLPRSTPRCLQQRMRAAFSSRTPRSDCWPGVPAPCDGGSRSHH